MLIFDIDNENMVEMDYMEADDWCKVNGVDATDSEVINDYFIVDDEAQECIIPQVLEKHKSVGIVKLAVENVPIAEDDPDGEQHKRWHLALDEMYYDEGQILDIFLTIKELRDQIEEAAA